MGKSMRSNSRGRLLREGALTTLAALLCAPAASAQQADETPAAKDDTQIVVVGDRRSAAKDILPLATLHGDAIVSTGTSATPDLLRAIRGSPTAADGSEPIFLLNAQRVSGYQEIGVLPPEAIEKVEGLPEAAARPLGVRPTRPAANFIN